MPSLRVSLVACLFATAIVPPRDAQAQEATPFRRGQWATDFFVGTGFVGGGLVKFRSPTRAWTLDGSVDLSSTRDTSLSGPLNSDQQFVTLRLGSRSYGRLGAHAMRLATFGITGNYGHNKIASGGSESRTTNIGGGIFGELGAQWMVSSQLGLGATWAVNATYSHHSGQVTSGGTPINDITGHGWNVSAGNFGLRGSIFF